MRTNLDTRNEKMAAEFVHLRGEEMQAERGRNRKTFDLGKGRRQTILYAHAAHYEKDGAWHEIDNTLIGGFDETGREVYRNRANEISFTFAKTAGEGMLMQAEFEGRKIAWQPDGMTGTAQADPEDNEQRLRQWKARKIPTEQDLRAQRVDKEGVIEYRNVRPGLHLRFLLEGDRLMEQMILDNEQAWNGLGMRMYGEGMGFTADEHGRIHVSENGEEIYVISAPYYKDATDMFIRKVDMLLLPLQDGALAVYSIPEEEKQGLVYPVTIDPTLKTSRSGSYVDDTTLIGSNPDKNYDGAGEMAIGIYNGAENAALIRFNTLPKLLTNDTIISAQLKVARNSGQMSSEKYIGAYGIAADWNETTATWNNFSIGSTSYVKGTAQDYVYSTNPSELCFDLTNLVREWYKVDANGNSLNRGVCLKKPSSGVTGDNYQKIYSSDNSAANGPQLVINYISHAGIEGWWTYDDMGLGRSGTGSVDLFNGNLIWQHTDTAMTGLRMPVGVTHTYNTAYVHMNSFGMGYGWRTNWNQTVQLNSIGGVSHAVWSDGDGTNHYFDLSGSAPYKDSEGMGVTYQKVAATSSDVEHVLLTDKGDTKMRFEMIGDRYYLKWIEDASGNRATGAYSGTKIISVTDAVGRVTAFAYNTSGLLESISVPGEVSGTTRKVLFAYSGTQLVSITYPDAAGQTSFTYANRLLTKVTNPNGISVAIAYESAPYINSALVDGSSSAAYLKRVKSMEYLGSGAEKGAKRIYTYNDVSTEVLNVTSTSADTGKTLVYQFNDRGNLISVRDELGFARYTRYSDNASNKPSELSKLQKATMNLLRRPDFNAGWEVSGRVSGTDSVAVDSANLCNGMRSLHVRKVVTGTDLQICQTVTLERGKTYTFSAYVKGSLPTSGSTSLSLRMKEASASEWSFGEDLTASPVENGSMGYDGWRRMVYTYTVPTASGSSTASVQCGVCISGNQADLYIGCPQLEEGTLPGRVNLITNGDFRNPDSANAAMPQDWALGADVPTASTAFGIKALSGAPSSLSGKCMQFRGEPARSSMYIRQEIHVNGSAGDSFVLGGWLFARSVPLDGVKRCGFAVRFGSGGSFSSEQLYQFNAEDVGWQYASFAVIAPSAYDTVRIDVTYARNANVAQFTNLFLYKEAYGRSYVYDANGNVTSAENYAGQKSSAVYDSYHNLTSYVPAGRSSSEKYTINYGSQPQKHLPVAEKSPMNMYTKHTYLESGLPSSESRVVYTERNNTDPTQIRTETGYDSTGNYAASWKDARGNSSTRSVNPRTGTTAWSKGPIGAQVNHTYDAADRVTKTTATQNGLAHTNTYAYTGDRLTEVGHNTTSDTVDVKYTFGYDGLGNNTTVKVGSQALVTKAYTADRNRSLSSETYANGGKTTYTYDAYNRLTEVTLDNNTSKKVTYEYGTSGNVERVTDAANTRVTEIRYDLAGREMEREIRENGEQKYLHDLTYDNRGSLVRMGERVSGGEYVSQYEYDSDERLVKSQYGTDEKKTITAYDALGRVSGKTHYVGSSTGLSETFSYHAGATTYSANAQTALVSAIATPNLTQSYTYDANGNITSFTANNRTCSYVYDDLGQLVRVNDQMNYEGGENGTTWVYAYDRGGNVLSKTRYAYTTGALGTAQKNIAYSYDSVWKDKLTQYGSKVIQSDAQGNVTHDSHWAYSWENGRRLKSMSTISQTMTFTYDENGQRIRKSYAGVTTDYTVQGKRIVHVKSSDSTLGEMHIYYDGARPDMVLYDGATYRYVHSLQGDILGLQDGTGEMVVVYRYDPWGRPVWLSGSMSDTLGALNPFRYRGYVYDTESGLYYLRSRYYNPNWGRFISTDAVLGRIGVLHSHCLFVYCRNCPVNYIDPSGCIEQAPPMEDGFGSACLSNADRVLLISPDRVVSTVSLSGILSFAYAPIVLLLGSIFHSAVTEAEELGNIASDYGMYKCKEAASAMEKYLRKNKKNGAVIEIRYPTKPGYIYSISTEKYISANGVHVGVCYQGIVYCNIHPYGLPEEAWLADFDGVGLRQVNRSDF